MRFFRCLGTSEGQLRKKMADLQRQRDNVLQVLRIWPTVFLFGLPRLWHPKPYLRPRPRAVTAHLLLIECANGFQATSQAAQAATSGPSSGRARSSGGRWGLIALAVVAVAGAGALLLLGGDRTAVAPEQAGEASTAPASSTATAGTAARPASAAPQFDSEDLEGLPMPPLPYVPQTAGPADLMRQAYVFAARNPDVLDYVPCYCGCGQTDGTRGEHGLFRRVAGPERGRDRVGHPRHDLNRTALLSRVTRCRCMPSAPRPRTSRDAVMNKYASQSAYATPTPPAPRGN